jgi:amidophosphoribosyltransferase
VTIYNEEKPDLLKTHKGNGLVGEVFSLSDSEKATTLYSEYAGRMGIGHTRYATSGSDSCTDAQPFERTHSRLWKWFSFAFNGNITNAPEMRRSLQEKGYHFKSTTDTEALMHTIAHSLGSESPQSLETGFADMTQQLDGAYTLVFVNAQGELVVLRDPNGFKPLSFVDTEDFFLAASESVALRPFAAQGIQDVNPGEMIRVHANKTIRSRFTASNHPISHCMFEWVYFSSAGSTLQGSSVYESRYRLGVELAKNENIPTNPEEWVVVNVPDTSKPAADGYAYTLNLPSKEGLLRNRYVGRTFIEGGKWQDKVREKFTINPSVLGGKKIILVEDSVVRGNTLKQLAKQIREEGNALEVHARIACPPILNPCFYGIDMSTFNELTAARTAAQKNDREHVRWDEETGKILARELGVDSLRYQSLEGLVNALMIPPTKLCMACLDGKYPTSQGKRLVQEAWSRYQSLQSGRRIYDT